MSLIVSNLNFSYGKNHVLKDISISFPHAKIISIIGPNGCGKTTLIKNLCGVLKPGSGKIYLGDKSIDKYSIQKLAKHIAAVHQSGSYYFDFLVEDYVLMGRYPYINRFKSETQEDINICDIAMKKTGVLSFKGKYISQLSGGERQRVMVARALAQQPKILLLDEPVSHLDLRYQLEILNICRALVLEDITVICTIHDVNLAAEYSDMIAVIKDGMLYGFDTPEKIVNFKMIKEIYGVKSEIHTEFGYPHLVSKGVF